MFDVSASKLVINKLVLWNVIRSRRQWARVLGKRGTPCMCVILILKQIAISDRSEEGVGVGAMTTSFCLLSTFFKMLLGLRILNSQKQCRSQKTCSDPYQYWFISIQLRSLSCPVIPRRLGWVLCCHTLQKKGKCNSLCVTNPCFGRTELP